MARLLLTVVAVLTTFTGPLAYGAIIAQGNGGGGLMVFDDQGQFIKVAGNNSSLGDREGGVILGSDGRIYSTRNRTGGGFGDVIRWGANLDTFEFRGDSADRLADKFAIAPLYDLVQSATGNPLVGSRTDRPSSSNPSRVSSLDVLEFDGGDGTYFGEFASVLGDSLAYGLEIGANGDLYALTLGFTGSRPDSSILRFDGATGSLVGSVVSSGSGGLDIGMDFKFGGDGNIYVTNRESGTNKVEVLRFDGTTGGFLDTFVDLGSDPNGSFLVRGLDFDSDGNLNVAFGSDILKYDISGNLVGTFVDGSSLPVANSAGGTGFSRFTFADIEITNGGGNNGGVVPEPSSFITFGVLAIWLGVARWWQKRRCTHAAG